MAVKKGSKKETVNEAEDTVADNMAENVEATEVGVEDAAETDEAQCSYFIDMNWYQDNDRSFTMLTASRLCPSSQKKKIPKSETALLKTIADCCSKQEDYITPNMPLLEMVFRLFLANSNQPMNLGRIQEELQQRLSASAEPRDVSIPKLKRILDNDRYYGLRPIPLDEDDDARISPQSD